MKLSPRSWLLPLLLVCLAGLASAQDRNVQTDNNGQPIFNALRYGTAFSWPILAASTMTQPFNANTRVVDLICSVACHVTQSATPATATTTSFLLPANTVVRLKVAAGGGDSLAVIRDSTNGTAFLVELN